MPLLNGRTSIVIAHRLSTILSVDNILVFEQGKIIQSEKHNELLAEVGFIKNYMKHNLENLNLNDEY